MALPDSVPASPTASQTPRFDDRNLLIGRVESAVSIAARRQTFRAAADEALEELRQECSRTMGMIRRLRQSSPLYGRASSNPRLGPDW